MSFTSKGGGLALKNNGAGKLTFQWVHGNPVFDDSQTETVMSLLFEKPWWGDPAGLRRSQLASIREDDATTRSRLEEYAREALKPAIDSGRLRSVTPTATRLGAGRWQLRLAWVTSSGRQELVDIPLMVT